MMRFLLRILPAVGLACCLAGCPDPDGKEPPNVLLISIDTLRADHLGCYGYTRPTSPSIDRLAREGVLFTNAYSASSWTVPSHMTMFTSLPSIIHGVDDVGKRLAPARVTLAERFLESGYDTAAFVSGPTMHAAFGFDQGFQSYTNLSGIAEESYGEDPLRVSRAWKESHRTITGPAVLRAVRDWLDGAGAGPFFLFVHLWDPHHDYIPRPPYDTRFDPDYEGSFDFSGLPYDAPKIAAMTEADKRHLAALYDGEIAATDAVVGEIVATLERLELLDDTLIVVTSDHGEEFFEHGQMAHGFTLHEEVVRVPLIFRMPGRAGAGRRVDTIFDQIHLMPTLLGAAGLGAGPEARGMNLADVLGGTPPPAGLKAFMRLSLQRPDPIYALRIENLKYHARVNPQQASGLFVYYYDLETDPAEAKVLNLDRAGEARAADLFVQRIDRYETFARSLPGSGATSHPLDAGTEEQLRALGYIE